MKKIYRYPLLDQPIKILHVQETVKKQKDKPDLAGYEVIFIHGKTAHASFLEKAPKEGAATANLQVCPNFGEGAGLRVELLSIKQ